MDDKGTFLNFMICTLIQDLRQKDVNIEDELCNVGHSFCRSLLEVLDFKREIDVQSLLYKITFVLLENIYSTSRRLDSSKTDKNEFFIIEYEPMFTKYVSIPAYMKDFCPESINCGVIEYALKASGFKSSVIGYVKPTEKYPDQVIYHIKIVKN